MKKLHFYEVKDDYIEYCLNFEPKIHFHKKDTRKKKRKYVGVIFEINQIKFYISLSSFKEKHKNMKDSLDFIKIGEYAVLNINNMIPVPDSAIIDFNINDEQDLKYKTLLIAEYIICQEKSEKIIRNAKKLFSYVSEGRKNKFTERCCDFVLLLHKSTRYKAL